MTSFNSSELASVKSAIERSIAGLKAQCYHLNDGDPQSLPFLIRRYLHTLYLSGQITETYYVVQPSPSEIFMEFQVGEQFSNITLML